MKVPVLLSLAALAACSSADRRAERRWLVARVDDTALVQLHAGGFDSLSLRDKVLCWHLVQAAIAGRDIFIDQKFAGSLAIRDVLEELWLHRHALTEPQRAEIERYMKLFWIHNGIHHAISTHKMPLQMTLAEWRDAWQRAAADGAVLPETADVGELHATLTDPERFASCTDKSPADGGDPLLASCNNLYVGVAMADVEGFTEHYALNSRLVKHADGRLEEQVYRIGDESHPPGLYAEPLRAVVGHLRAAHAVAPPATQAWLDPLMRYYHTGEAADWRAFNIAWVADKDAVVDTINGFVEVYVDARGRKGAWEAVVSFRDPEKTRAIEKLAGLAQWFEDRMPWADEFKKKDVQGISAKAISVVTETGDSGPITPVGINLPNENDIREQYGSKSVNLGNVVEAYEATSAGGAAKEFAFTPEEAARAERYAARSGDLHTNLHEVVGHASGALRPDVPNAMQRLGTFASTLEEGRADLVALYWIADPKLRELGLVDDDDMALAEYESYARNALLQLRRVPKGGKLEEDHMRNRQMVIHWLIAHSDAIAVERRDGKTYYRVTGIEPFRMGVGELLSEVMRIKATGDFKAGKQLVETYGTKVDPTLHAEVLERVRVLGLPSVTGFIQPELRLVRDGGGKIVDVVVEHPYDLAAQKLRWSGKVPRD